MNVIFFNIQSFYTHVLAFLCDNKNIKERDHQVMDIKLMKKPSRSNNLKQILSFRRRNRAPKSSHELPGAEFGLEPNLQTVPPMPYRVSSYFISPPHLHSLLSFLCLSKFYLCIYGKNKFKFKFMLHIDQISKDLPNVSQLSLIIAIPSTHPQHTPLPKA